MEKNKLPIGIFDSGIGGLTVAHAVRTLLPKEDIIYFGDTAHMPYGDKSKELIQNYSRRIASFLVNHKCKAIVIACNTASAFAYDDLKSYLPETIILKSVIDPAANFIAQNFSAEKVGVIGTRGTINTGAYRKKINALNPSVDVYELPTPLLAPLIEEGFYNNSVSSAIINAYLSYPDFSGISALILGCTHYPLIKQEVNHYFNGRVQLVDSAEKVAIELKADLEKENLINPSGTGWEIFYVSDISQSFQQSAARFFGAKVELLEKRV